MLWCKEASVHVERNLGAGEEKRTHLGEGDAYETKYATTGELYRACMKAFGRCTGKVYIDERLPLGTATKRRQVGWIFLKKAPKGHEGCTETWITCFTKEPVKRVRYEVEYPNFR